MVIDQIVYQKAKSVFSEAEYKRFFQAAKTIENEKIILKKTFVILQHIFSMLPEFDLIMAALFVNQTPIPPSIVNRYLNETQKEIAKKLSDIADPALKNPSRKTELTHRLFEAFVYENRVLYYFLATLFTDNKAMKCAKAEKKIEYAQVLFSIGAPLAYRLGLHEVKEHFETVAFSLLFPREYKIIEAQRTEYVRAEHLFLRKVVGKMRYFLKKHCIPFTIKSRVKNIYSIYRKLKKKGRTDIKTLNDIFAVRVIVKDPLHCYIILGLLHQHFPYIPGKIKDYISKPKKNAYQSLHTTLEVPFDEQIFPVEIQIRTEEMNTVATSGIAAHLLYKKQSYGNPIESKKEMKKKMAQILSHFSESSFLQAAEDDIFSQHIFVFSKDEAIFPLLKGATMIDFAYSIHTDVGNHLKGGIVNGKAVDITYKLRNGDRVEALTDSKITRQENWLRIASMPFVKKIIRSFYHKES